MHCNKINNHKAFSKIFYLKIFFRFPEFSDFRNFFSDFRKKFSDFRNLYTIDNIIIIYLYSTLFEKSMQKIYHLSFFNKQNLSAQKKSISKNLLINIVYHSISNIYHLSSFNIIYLLNSFYHFTLSN